MPHRTARPAAAATLTAAVALLAGLLAGPPASARPSTDPGPTAGPVRNAGAGARPLVLTGDDGRTRLVGARAGRVLSTAPAGARGVVAAARAQLPAYAAAFGLADLAGLRAVRASRAPSGHHVVRFQQSAGGAPVLGGQLVTVLDPSGDLVSVSGEVSRTTGSPAYPVAASAAARVARRATARAHHLPTSVLASSRPTRLAYDASLVEPGGRPGARAAWRVEVTSPGRLDLRELVVVDAADGRVALQVDQVAHVLDRVVCDDAGLSKDDEVCRPGEYTRVEGQPPTGIADVDQAYDLTGATADWFAQRLGVDLTDLIGSDEGDGRRLRSTTRYCGPEGCPLENAFWTGDQMVYGAGFTAADDVVAHELTHGVTQQVAALVYWFQSGAINESMSDVFGELVDLADGLGTDTEDVRWLLGEDLAAFAGGVGRDMADPPAYGQPDHTGSDLYDFAPDYDDNGGVHTNSGVPNKTAYLVADGTAGEPGGAFNGTAFPGVGTDKTTLVYWAALQLLTPGADFTDLAAALQQGCANLAATATAGITTMDCSSVAAATAATGLTRWAGPSEPRDVRMTTGEGSVRLRWARPASDGSSPLTSYVVWVRPAVAGEDFVALEPSALGHTVTGLRPGVAYTVGVAAVTADGTSTSVSRPFSAAAVLLRWPGSVTYGDPLRLPGRLVGPGAAALPGRELRLLRRHPGESAYDVVREVTTAADGSFRLRVRARRGATYVVAYAGSATDIGVRTPARTVLVRQRVTLATDPTLRREVVPRFRGTVTPARPGAQVRLQWQRPDGSWRTVSQGRLDAASRYALAATGPPARSGRWRVQVPRWPSRGLATGRSREVLVSIR